MAILALGVAVFFSIRLANRAAVSGFALFTESLSGESDWLVCPKAGFFGEEDLGLLRQEINAIPAAIFPLLDTTAASGGKSFRIIGTDLVALANAVFLDESSRSNPINLPEGKLTEVLGRPDRCLISEAAGFQVNDSISLIVNGQTKIIVIAGLLKDDPLNYSIPRNLIVLDLPGPQELTGLQGKLSRLEVRIPPGADFERNRQSVGEVLKRWGGERFVVRTASTHRESSTKMSAAFRMNLTILSLLTLVVGAYLILQAMEASVIKRRAEIAVLRCLGVSPRDIRRAWMQESFVLGILGSATGIAVGFLLSQAMVRAVASTVNGLYFETVADSAGFDLREAGLAFAFGLVVSLLAGWMPAREAANVAPAHALAKKSRGGGLSILRKPWWGVGLLVAATALAFCPPYLNRLGTAVPVAGYVAALLFLFAATILAGLQFTPLSMLLEQGKQSPLRRYAASQFRVPEGRHRLAAAGLVAAFGMSAAMGILVSSFQTTLTGWIRQLLNADIYIAANAPPSARNQSTIPESIWNGIDQDESVAGLDRMRRYSILYKGDEVWLGGSEYSKSGRYLQLSWIDRPQDVSHDALMKREPNGEIRAWINESFHRKYRSKTGDILLLPIPGGEVEAVVKGIYTDYSSERGVVVVSRIYTSKWYRDSSVTNLAVYLQPGVDQEAWLADFQETYPELTARTNARLRADSLRLFRQTFRVTYVLEAIAVIIAVAGLGLAMAGLLLERKPELGILKELGLSRREIARAAMWEGMGLSLAGTVGGLAVSLLLGWLLVYVINVQSFGWTLNFSVPWMSFLLLSLLMLWTGGTISWLTGYRTANLRSDDM